MPRKKDSWAHQGCECVIVQYPWGYACTFCGRPSTVQVFVSKENRAKAQPYL